MSDKQDINQIAAEAADYIKTALLDWARLIGHVMPLPDTFNETNKSIIEAAIEKATQASEQKCPGPQQHGHPLVYESHCDHGETKPHVIADAMAGQWGKVNMRNEEEANEIVDEGTMFYNELHAVVRRYLEEAPHLTYYEMIGAIECCKQDILDAKKKPKQ